MFYRKWIQIFFSGEVHHRWWRIWQVKKQILKVKNQEEEDLWQGNNMKMGVVQKHLRPRQAFFTHVKNFLFSSALFNSWIRDSVETSCYGHFGICKLAWTLFYLVLISRLRTRDSRSILPKKSEALAPLWLYRSLRFLWSLHGSFDIYWIEMDFECFTLVLWST